MPYEIQFCGDEYYTAGMRDYVAVPIRSASEVRLWEATYWRDDDPSQGTYITGDEPITVAVDDGDGGFTCDDGESEWYGWQGAIKHATRDHPDAAEIAAYIDAEF